jgi:hypothetical protein
MDKDALGLFADAPVKTPNFAGPYALKGWLSTDISPIKDTMYLDD